MDSAYATDAHESKVDWSPTGLNRALTAHDKAIAELRETVSAIEDRLALVLLPAEPHDDGGVSAQAVPMMSDASRSVDDMTDRLGHTINRLSSLLRRIDL